MKRILLALVLAAAWLAPRPAHALEFANIRSTYGPGGATRDSVKIVPGDVVFMYYDILGLQFDAKSGKATYVTALEFIDAKGGQLLKKESPNEATAPLGGDRVPGDLHIVTGPSLAPGKYTVKLTVTDKLAKQAKSFTVPIELVGKEFGFVGVTAPSIGFPGQHYMVSFGLVNMQLDPKKQPNVEVAIKILGEGGKAVSRPAYITLPKDVPEGIDVQKENFVPLSYPFYLNRPGLFTIDITAIDKVGNRTIRLSYPLHVLDLAKIAGGAK
jgi:hypothetical protein